MNILYILKHFPGLSETFISNEMIELINKGHNISIISLEEINEKKVHGSVKRHGLVERNHLLKYGYFYPKDGLLSRQEIFEKSVKRMLDDGLLSDKEKIELLHLCYDKKQGKEISLRKFLYYLDVAEVIKEKNIEHIHCHFAVDNVRVAYIINQALGIPYTFITHAYDIFVNPDEDIKKWADSAKKVITVSEYNKKYMVEKFGIEEGKIEVVGCGIELDKLKAVDFRSDKLNILSIGRLVEKKGIKYLIEACKLLKGDFECSIIGEGILKEELQNLIKKLDLDDKVHIKGTMVNEDVLDELKKSSVFVLPCIEASDGDKDGVPVSLMESMAMQIPVISTDVTGIPELINNNVDGVIVRQNNPEKLAEAIIKIKDDKEFAERIRKKGREKIMEKHDIEKNVKKLVDVFEE